MSDARDEDVSVLDEETKGGSIGTHTNARQPSHSEWSQPMSCWINLTELCPQDKMKV